MTFHSDSRGHAQLFAPQLDAAEAGHDVEGQPHIRGQQPAEEHAVDVQRAQACRRSEWHVPNNSGQTNLAAMVRATIPTIKK